MKKLILFFLLIFVLGVSLAFADKSRFYKNGKVVDSMYVDSPEGLRVRSEPKLSAKKICTALYQMQVKVVAIGKEETIDGITAPWVEILVPRYEWKGEEPEYGWVFGGYLNNEREQEKIPLDLALQLFKWYSGSIDEDHDYFDFCDGGFNSHKFRYELHVIRDEGDGYFTSITYYGTWKVLSKYKIQLTGFVYDSWGETMKSSLTFECQIETMLNMMFTNFYGPLYEISENSIDYFGDWGKNRTIDLKNPGIYYIKYADHQNEEWNKNANVLSYLSPSYSDYKNKLADDKELIKDLIQAGVDPTCSTFVEQYHDYWDPIMAEHQKNKEIK